MMLSAFAQSVSLGVLGLVLVWSVKRLFVALNSFSKVASQIPRRDIVRSSADAGLDETGIRRLFEAVTKLQPSPEKSAVIRGLSQHSPSGRRYVAEKVMRAAKSG